MTTIKTLPTIYKTKTLFNLSFEFLDPKIYTLFEKNSFALSTTKQKQVKAICLLFNCFLGIQNKKVSIIQFLNKKETNIILSEFIWFLTNGGFNFTKATIYSYSNIFSTIISQINLTKNINLSINLDVSFDINSAIEEQVKYFNGWWIKAKDEKYEVSISLHKFFNKFGHNNTNILFNKIMQFSIENPSVFTQSIYTLNNFIDFLSENAETAFDWDKELIIKSFIKHFFIQQDKNNNDLHTSKKQWNCFNKVAINLFNLPEELFLYIKTKQKQTFEHNIKHTKNGQVKVKLITEIPLEICDDKALAMLIQKINQDVDLVKDWASHTINSFLEITRDKSKLLKSEDYGFKPKYIPKKDISEREKFELFSWDSVFQRKHALAIAYLLIAEHPEITESFLLNCEINTSIKETDQGMYLISYKNRKGPNLAEQKILLNPISLKLINILIEETKVIRKYLENNNNTDYKKLFIFCNSSDLHPAAPKILNEREGVNRDTNKNIINFLTKERNFEVKSAIDFANKITLTKMRASRGVQVYLTTESTTKMAQALGHTRHRPELLAHYLPEPITDFFQRRWISIFQKGIICEALKDSEFLLKATGFTSMTKLDEFLRNHTLKKIPDNSDLILNKNKKISVQHVDNSEVYISVDEQKLSALLSIQSAVIESKEKNKVTPSAYYWSLFTERLTKEILENRIYSSFRGTLDFAKENINKDLFKDIIYVK